MAISFKHAFTSAKADGLDTTLVQPSHWNAQHELTLNTNNLIGRKSSGNGAAEEIACTTLAQQLIGYSTKLSWQRGLDLEVGVDVMAYNATPGDLRASENLSDVDDAEKARKSLGLEIGTDVEAYDAGSRLEVFAGQLDGRLYSSPTTIYLIMNAPFAMRIDSFRHKLSVGTLKATVQIQGFDVTGCSNITVNTTESQNLATAERDVEPGRNLSLLLSGATSADQDFSFQINATRT